MDFKNKIVIITGASSGIGAASAVLFAKYGAKLTLVGRSEHRLRNVAEKCFGINGLQPCCVRVDLTEKGSCAEVIAKTVATYDRIDVLVNCAVAVHVGSLFDDDIDAFDEMININLRVPYKLSQLALPYLVKTKGNIVNINGTRYSKSRHGFLPYCISKSGLERFTKSAAIEVGTEGVRINSVQPGVTRTNIFSNLAMDEEERRKEYERLSCTMRILEPEEVARMIVFVASDVCPNLNGAVIRLDGSPV